ncbi:hypothetical protein EB796_012034 [Bugula neritina]|uniref:ATP5J n=1 Tax=Bugula neritina TaxID=10212 RepID=A0A7J7JUS0_BUGNE|nr:hypothetical protein EB796_012034 [Bugula neritina]
MLGRSLMLVCRHTVNTSTRQLSVTPAVCKAATATDPIQQLFVDKVRLYGQKSKAAGGKLVDATPEVEAKYAAEIDRVQKQFGAVSGEDFTKFPVFNFQDTELEPVGVTVETKADEVEEVAVEEQEVDNRPFFETS